MVNEPEDKGRQKLESGFRARNLHPEWDDWRRGQAYDDARRGKTDAARKRESIVLQSANVRLELGVNLLGFVILEVAIVVGWIAATGGHLNDTWKTVLVALAAVALGFGAAQLLARRSSNSQGRELERDFYELKARSSRLLGAIDKPPHPPESGASPGSAQ